MEQRDIKRLREPKFTVTRRGYSQREVDNFLLQLADWLESTAAEDIGSYAVKRKLELVAKSTAKILLTTEQEAEELRRNAEQQAAETVKDATTAAQQARQAAADHARTVRETADREAQEKVAAATSRARGLVEEGERRRATIESAIAELQAARERTLGELDRLSEDLRATVETRNRQAPDPFAASGSEPRRRGTGTGAQERAPDQTGQRERA